MDIIPSPETPADDEDSGEDLAPAMWHDSDDERLAVSLADQAKLRKLRVAESEDVISGKEYVRRLRRQFQRLHPTPEWANPELAAKRRKMNADDSDSDQELDSEDEDEQLSIQPLAKLLQNANDLTRIEDNARSGGKRKLRQEVLDIQRLKDVGKAQPVRHLFSDLRIEHGTTNNESPVFCRLAYFPSSLSALAFLWSRINSLPAPHLSVGTSPEPSLDIFAHQAHADTHIRFRPTNSEQDLRFWSAAVLPHLGPGHGQGGQSQWNSRP